MLNIPSEILRILIKNKLFFTNYIVLNVLFIINSNFY